MNVGHVHRVWRLRITSAVLVHAESGGVVGSCTGVNAAMSIISDMRSHHQSFQPYKFYRTCLRKKSSSLLEPREVDILPKPYHMSQS